MLGQSYIDDLLKLGDTLVAETLADLAESHPDLDIRTDVVIAQPVPALVGESENAALMVLGSRGLGGFKGMLIGSTAVALAAHGRCPVAVVRGRTPDGDPPTDGPVVVGVDGSSASAAAVALAFEEASLRGTDLVAVHTFADALSEYAFAYPRQSALDWTAMETKPREMLAERLAGWQEKYPDVAVNRVVVRDHPASELLERSEDAQLLVVGSRGRGGFAGMVLGSTSQALIYHATCPLLVARPTT